MRYIPGYAVHWLAIPAPSVCEYKKRRKCALLQRYGVRCLWQELIDSPSAVGVAVTDGAQHLPAEWQTALYALGTKPGSQAWIALARTPLHSSMTLKALTRAQCSLACELTALARCRPQRVQAM